jgi:hypothetical protein
LNAAESLTWPTRLLKETLRRRKLLCITLKLEHLVSDDEWTLPKYRELLFLR